MEKEGAVIEIVSRIKAVIKRMLAVNTENTIGETAVSDVMERNISLWLDIFSDKPPWKSKKLKTINLAALSTAYIARLVNSELKFELSGGKRAEYINSIIEKYVLSFIVEKTQLALATGQVVIKPFFNNKDIEVEFVRADCFYPLELDTAGNALSAAFIDTREKGQNTYTRIECHRLQNGGYTITNRAYKGNFGALGREISLDTLPEWEGLSPETTLSGIEKPLFSCFKTPFANNIALSSRLPVSMYANAITTLEEIDRIYTAYCWEFESAKRKIFVEAEALTKDNKGNIILPDNDLYIALDMSQSGETDKSGFFNDYTPEIREQHYQNGINQQLRIYEAQTGVSSGTYSFDIKGGAVTATEVISRDRAAYYTVKAIQDMEKAAFNDLIYALDVYAALLGNTGGGSIKSIIEFSDSVFEDTGIEFQRRMQLVQAGIMRPEEVRAWYLGEDIETALKNMPDMNSLTDEG